MKICMLVYSFYECDIRVMQYASALTRRGDTVDVICLRRQGQPRYQVLDRVNVYQIQERTVNERNQLSYFLRILLFFFHSAAFLAKKHFSDRYQLIHVHSVPDFLVFAGLVPKLCGVPVILDIHDLLPEFYASKFNAPAESLILKCLRLIEKESARFADHVIIANHLWHRRLLARSVRAEKCTPIRNYPDPSEFFPRPRVRSDGKFLVIYPGTLNWHQGMDIALKAFAKLKVQLPNAEFHIYGEGPMKHQLLTLTQDLGLSGSVLFKDWVPVRQIARLMAESDLAVVPKRASSTFGTEAASTKVFEFLALGVPVIVSRTKIDTFYFSDSTVRFFESENVDDLAQCMLDLAHNPLLRSQLANNGRQYDQQNSWNIQKHDYLRLVDLMVYRNTAMHSPKPPDSGVRQSVPLP
jgi:glycosyltransferase involved in cell wall biosynthesis